MPVRRLVFCCRIAALAAILLCAMPLVGGVGPKAQRLDFHDPSTAPASWVQFAALVKFRFEEWIAANDSTAARFRTYLKIHAGTSDGPPSSLTVRTWVNPDGSVARVSFPALTDPVATKDLHTILTRGNIGEPPPPEMVQPLNLRFSFRAG